MSRAARHLERLLEALQSDSTLGGGGTRDEIAPPTSDSIRTGGSDDALGKETPPSLRVSVSNSASDDPSDPSTLCDGDGSKYYREETARLVQQLGDSRVQVATLEAQVEFLTNKVEEQETVDSLYIQRLEEEVLRLEEIVEREMCNLSRRQNQVEQDVPTLEDQLVAIKDALHNFDISEPMYMELKSIPEQRRTVREQILIMAYEKYQRFREENQELRMSRDTSREALTRANDEVQRLTRELQRECANHATDRRESELDLSAHAARVERLEAERRDSLVQIEVLSAKGALFDEVQAKLEILERSSIDAENQKAVMAATLQVAIQEKDTLRDAMKEKDHTLDLLSMDKIYLSKEVHCQAEQVKKLEAELERQHEKLREVKRARTDLYNKVLADNKDSQTANEHRLQAEISRIQERTNQDIEKIRNEANAVADEKVRTFREMRDEALATAETCRAELRDSKAAYDELLLKFRELQRVADCKEAETRSNLKVSNFELDRLKIVLDETKNALDQTRLENEAWVAKVKILKEKVSEEKNRPLEELKNELEKPVSELKEELRVTRAQLEVYQKEKNAQLKAYQRDKEAQLKAYQSERKSPLEEVSEGEKVKSFSVARRASTSGGSAGRNAHETKQLEEQLRSVTEEKDRVSIRLQSVQDDIRKLLRARGSVEQLQSMLKEKGVSLGGGNRLQSITTSTKSSSKVKRGSPKMSPKIASKVSPRISNLDRSVTPTTKELRTLIEHRETPPICHQHRSCSPHYPKAYEELVDASGRQGNWFST